jgi:branched-chain amino acid transport system permease protein
MAGIFSMLSISLNLIMGYVGQFPLGHQVFFGIGAYAAALISTHWNVGFVVSLGVAISVASIAGLVIGFPTLKLKGPFFVIASLAFNEIVFLLAWNWTTLTHGPDGITHVPRPELFGFAIRSKPGLYFLMLALLAIVVWVNVRLIKTKNGRAYLAVRDNEELAESLGINIYWTKLEAFIISAAVGGMAGGFYGHFEGFVSPTVFSFSYLTTMLVMVYVGGQGTLPGPIIGAILFTFVLEYLHAFQMWRWIVFGVILIVCVLFLPEGIAGLFLKSRIKKYVFGDRDACTR